MVLETSYIAYDKFIDKNEPNVDCAQRSENKNEDDKKENSSNQEKVNNYKQVKILELSNKLKKLDFTSKRTATAGVDDENPFSISIVSDKEIKITHNYAGVSYNLELENAISVGAGFGAQGSGEANFYILTADGSVYKIIDEMDKVKSNKEYKGTLKNIGIKNAIQIAVTDNFSLNDNAFVISPTIYIKTSDNQTFTDESLLDNEAIVEVIEK
ncbi:MAG: hypothetical protein SPI44_00805 [Bacilli bacterium]|nr:hypothetical protein [Bacilli bacterium]